MRPSKLRELYAQGKTAFMPWCSIGSPFAAELLGSTGADAVCIDLQHAPYFLDTAIPMLQALSATPAMPVVRVSANQLWEINKVLDAGAYGIICPLVNTPEQARQFVAACRYPPRGERSAGPARGLLYGGDDYLAHADDTILKLAMIETKEGFDNLERILAVEGLDGVFVGPSDLTVSLTGTSKPFYEQEPLLSAATHIAHTARHMGKYCGAWAANEAQSATATQMGFHLVACGPDAVMIKTMFTERINRLRGVQSEAPASPNAY